MAPLTAIAAWPKLTSLAMCTGATFAVRSLAAGGYFKLCPEYRLELM